MIKGKFGILILLFLSFNNYLGASHLTGGEIVLMYSGVDKDVFQVKIDRDRNEIRLDTFPPAITSIDRNTNTSTVSIKSELFSHSDYSPLCNSTGSAITCANPMSQPGWPWSAASVNCTDTIHVTTLTASNTGDGYAHLIWSTSNNPPIPSNGIYYYIYREYPLGIWTLLDSVTAIPGINRYDDPVTICNDTMNYRIEIPDSAGCRSVSNVDGDQFQDLIPPYIPVIDSVSVDAAGLATVAWIQDGAKDTRAYLIFGLIGSNWVPLDTVIGINNVFYPSVLDAKISSIPFRILAMDSCGNPSALGSVHNTVHLTASLDVCQSSIRLSWNKYINWPGSVQYTVYVSANNGVPVLLNTTSQTTFVHNQLTQNTTYCYFIRAVDGTNVFRTSSSNRVCLVR